MKIKTLLLILAASSIMILTTGFLSPSDVMAQNRTEKSKNGVCPDLDGDPNTTEYIKLSVPVDQQGSDCVLEDSPDEQNNPIFIYLRNIIRFVGAATGLVLILVIVIGGVRYTASG